MKPLIIGEAPSRTSDPRRPITGACGRRLADFAGLGVSTFARMFDRVNVLDTWPGSDGEKGARWPLELARSRARRMSRRFARKRTIVLLGWRVADVFGLRYVEYFERSEIVEATVVVVPHPSHVNRWFNDPKNVEKMRAFWRGLVDEQKKEKP